MCSKHHPLSKQKSVTKQELERLKYVSLFQSSTVQAIRSTLAEHRIEWKALQVVLVRLPEVKALISPPRHKAGVDVTAKSGSLFTIAHMAAHHFQLVLWSLQSVPHVVSAATVHSPCKYALGENAPAPSCSPYCDCSHVKSAWDTVVCFLLSAFLTDGVPRSRHVLTHKTSSLHSLL